MKYTIEEFKYCPFCGHDVENHRRDCGFECRGCACGHGSGQEGEYLAELVPELKKPEPEPQRTVRVRLSIPAVEEVRTYDVPVAMDDEDVGFEAVSDWAYEYSVDLAEYLTVERL